jgi:pectate lyase
MNLKHHARYLAVLAALAAMSGVAAQTVGKDRDVAPASGWAGQNGGTTGGSAAALADVFTVGDKKAFLAALSKAGTRPKIIRVNGTIDFREGTEYKNSADQDARGKVDIPINTTIIGVNANAGFLAAQIRVKGQKGRSTWIHPTKPMPSMTAFRLPTSPPTCGSTI